MQTNQTPQPSAYLRLADMRARYRVSGSTIWKWAADPKGTFPKPIKLGANTTVWRLADLLKWEDEQAGKVPNQSTTQDTPQKSSLKSV